MHLSSKAINKKKLLSNPEIKQIYEQWSKGKLKGGGKMRGGSWDDFVGFLKDSHIISNIGNVVAPVLGGLAAGLVTANPIGAAVGAAAGSSANEWIKSQGFGMRGGDSRRATPLTLRGRGFSANTAYGQLIQKGRGNSQAGTTAYGQISSEFGKIKF